MTVEQYVDCGTVIAGESHALLVGDQPRRFGARRGPRLHDYRRRDTDRIFSQLALNCRK